MEGAIEAILMSNVKAQFEEANGKEPTDKEMDDILNKMKEDGLYEKAAERIQALLGGFGGAEEEEEEDEEEEDEEEEKPKESTRPKKKTKRA